MTRPLSEQEVLSRMGVTFRSTGEDDRSVARKKIEIAVECVDELLRSLGYDDVANELATRWEAYHG